MWSQVHKSHEIIEVESRQTIDISSNRLNTAPGVPIGVKIDKIFHANQTFLIHDTNFERNHSSLTCNYIRNLSIKIRKDDFKKKEKDISNKIALISNKALTRKHKDELNTINQNYEDGSTKPIWGYLKKIRNQTNNQPKHQELKKDDGTMTKNKIDNLEAWGEWARKMFFKENTKPNCSHITLEDIHNNNIFNTLGEQCKFARHTDASDTPINCDDTNWKELINARNNSRVKRFEDECPDGKAIIDSLCNPFHENEVYNAINSTKRRKGFGADRVPAEIIKSNISYFSKLFTSFFNYLFIHNCPLPNDWTTAVLCMLHKKKRKDY